VTRDVCHVLAADPDLAEGLSGPRLERARRDCIAGFVVVDAGAWEPEREEADAVRGGIGLLVLDGLLVRRVGRGGRFGAELLGPGDLLRPWQHDGEDTTLPFETSFRVMQRLAVALLDLAFAARLAPYPEIVSALVGRALQRSRTLAVNIAIAHHPRIDHRLLLLLWHLADRWGRVTSAGIRIPLRLPHALLADIVAARRPSVTSGLQKLEREGRLSRDEEHVFVLHGQPPAELYEITITPPAGHEEA
jgi:CRP/FNR family cyclic AMP-dependent transcriptional regulator